MYGIDPNTIIVRSSSAPGPLHAAAVEAAAHSVIVESAESTPVGSPGAGSGKGLLTITSLLWLFLAQQTKVLDLLLAQMMEA
jgi:hypothetical protein